MFSSIQDIPNFLVSLLKLLSWLMCAVHSFPIIIICLCKLLQILNLFVSLVINSPLVGLIYNSYKGGKLYTKYLWHIYNIYNVFTSTNRHNIHAICFLSLFDSCFAITGYMVIKDMFVSRKYTNSATVNYLFSHIGRRILIKCRIPWSFMSLC